VCWAARAADSADYGVGDGLEASSSSGETVEASAVSAPVPTGTTSSAVLSGAFSGGPVVLTAEVGGISGIGLGLRAWGGRGSFGLRAGGGAFVETKYLRTFRLPDDDALIAPHAPWNADLLDPLYADPQRWDPMGLVAGAATAGVDRSGRLLVEATAGVAFIRHRPDPRGVILSTHPVGGAALRYQMPTDRASGAPGVRLGVLVGPFALLAPDASVVIGW